MTINCTIPMGVTTLLSSLVITCIIVYRSADCKSLYDACPDRQSFEPCECNEDKSEIRCGMGFSVPMNVLYLFRDSHPVVVHNNDNRSRYRYHHLTVENSSLEMLLNNMFGKFEFDAITIRNNYYLSHLQPSLFDSSATINSLTLDSNPNLFANDKSVVNVFTIIANLIHLEALAINNCGLPFIASNALASLSKLVRLDLHNNQLKQIDPNTFSRLFSLQILDLSQNMINNLLPNSLNLSSSQPCYDSYRRQDIHYFIDLSHNNLSVESFAPDTFNLSCSAKLQLTNNSIELLDENVFRPLFRYYTIIQLYNNPIECLHCNQSWLMKGRHCLDHNNNTTTRYYMVIDFACHNEMSLYHFIANCPQYAKQMDHLEVEPKSSSLFVVNKYLDSYPADFREHDSQLLRCQSDFYSITHKTTNRSTLPVYWSLFFAAAIIIMIVIVYLLNRQCK
ncbi:uncharacterized protein LOC124499476 [Dermatophagoides farinae]|uniref:Leucine rich repeat containing protein 3 n=1 Tax=Dermatophagoides farinae TaxID=6954 RepID=A0A922I6N1_DERFA|nr:uncharacterized protein LOC124499476 [Dermatophagoides farinae]KAH7645154.1 leucine rich repeat containing protein 3 [Dermatophagoides farinae]KAH9521009.1 hypothetical protein DERF_004684 [Dermatophagoides farinae]